MIPEVSILMPVRNGEGTVAQAVESCLAQTFGDFELLLADDGSTDDTAGILDRFSRIDRRVRVLRVPAPGGIVAAHTVLTAEARAPLLARMDADDVSRPARLERQVAALRERPELAGVGSLVRIARRAGNGEAEPAEGFLRYQKWLNSLVEPEEIARERFIESPVVHPSVTMRRAALDKAGRYRDMPWAEDYDLFLRMMACGMPLAKVPEVLLDWYDSPGRLTRTDRRYSLENFLAAKAHFLGRMDAVRRFGVEISGAGPTGKMLARALLREAVLVHALYDTSPRRAGTSVAGVPVRGPEEMGIYTEGAPVQLAAVAQPGRRDVLRELLRGLGYTEGESFYCVA